ncbi:MAG: hypothetical protein QXJ02_01130 [Candidatus Bathyarchaeia archaeon]
MSSRATNSSSKISSFVIMIILITLALSFVALVLALQFFAMGEFVTAISLILMGFAGVGIAGYWVMRLRQRVKTLSTESLPMMTTLECRSCGLKSVREFQRGDYIFKEGEKCSKCQGTTMIVAIFKETKET